MTDGRVGGGAGDAESVDGLRATIDDLERRVRSVTGSPLRHDIGNAMGAARNALVLYDENTGTPTGERFIQIARRNVARVEELLKASAEGRSGRNERNDLGGAGERENRDTLGL